jgi:hypothetical protein
LDVDIVEFVEKRAIFPAGPLIGVSVVCDSFHEIIYYKLSFCFRHLMLLGIIRLDVFSAEYKKRFRSFAVVFMVRNTCKLFMPVY